MNNSRRLLQGYATNREFGGLKVPASMQNLLLRDYAARNNFIFKLSVGEYAFPGSFLQLEGIIKNLAGLEGVAMTSMYMLPVKKYHRERIYKEFFQQGAALHLVLENIVIRSEADVAFLEEILAINQTLKLSLEKIPGEILPVLQLPDTFS